MSSVIFRLVVSPALHPHLIIEPPPIPRDGCRYHISLELPDAIFIDRDEIKDQWSTSETVSWALSPDKIDIERPIRNDTEPVQLSLDLDPRVTSLDIPLHTRYLRPNAQGREEVVVFGEATVQDGWACDGQCSPHFIDRDTRLTLYRHRTIHVTRATTARGIVELSNR